MSPRPANSKTHRFIEILALITLAYYLIDAWITPNRLVFDPVSIVNTVSTALLGIGLFFRPVRKPSWILLWLAGLTSILFHPHAIDGTLVCLFSAFLLFASGWFARLNVPVAVVMAVSLLAAQVGSLFLVPDPHWGRVVQLVVTDTVLAFLTVTFRRDLVTVTEKELRPVLSLAEFELTDRESQIIHLIWGGLSAKEIADELDLSYGRVRNLLCQIHRKLGVTEGQDLKALINTHRIVINEQREQGGNNSELLQDVKSYSPNKR